MADSDKNTRTYIEISPPTRALLDVAVAESGQSMVVFLARIVSWFVTQDQTFRRAVNAGDEAAVDMLLRNRLAQIQAEKRDQPLTLTFDEAASVARLMIDRMQHLQEDAARELKQQVKRAK